MNSSTASPGSDPSGSRFATGSGSTVMTHSSGRCKGSRLVARMRTPGQAVSIRVTAAAAEATTCSQLSRMTSAGVSASTAPSLATTSASSPVPPASSRIRSASTEAPVRRLRTRDRSANQGPASESRSDSAKRRHSAVLPIPPGPTTVTSFRLPSRYASPASSSLRPTNSDRRTGRDRWPEPGRESRLLALAVQPTRVVGHFFALEQVVNVSLPGLQGPIGLDQLLELTRWPAKSSYRSDKRRMRRRLVVALLDTSHDGRAHAAFRGEGLLLDPAALPPGTQLAPHPGHHFGALAADAVASRQEAVRAPSCPGTSPSVTSCPSPWPRDGRPPANRTLRTEPLVRHILRVEHRAYRRTNTAKT